MTSTEIITSPTVVTEPEADTTDDGDHDRMAHIVVPASAVTEAMVTGKPCRALCGKTWVPSRDPARYPVCPTCKEVAVSMGWRIPSA